MRKTHSSALLIFTLAKMSVSTLFLSLSTINNSRLGFANIMILVASDLDAPSTFGVSDKYRVFELETPFARTNIN